ncbi:MAG: hypothetical protein K8R79_10355, partial [Calditrichales bacterium]|nr:hypothetical protein [Calditrichales bacterium]
MIENGVGVHQFSPEFHDEIERTNENFMKWATLKNKNEKAKKLKPKNHLTEIAVETNIGSLSDIALQKFLTESKRKYKPKSDGFLQELKEMDLLEYDEKSQTYLPTGNAILLFGKNPRNKFPNAAIKAKVDYGNGEAGAETFGDA